MTNFEKIKNMSVDEMSTVIGNLLYGTDGFDPCELCIYHNVCDLNKLAFSSVACLNAVNKWLESEVTENDKA